MKKLSLFLITSIFLISLVSAGSVCIDLDSPQAPSELTISGTINNIFLSWTKVKDSPDCSEISYYEIYKDSEFIGSTVKLNYTDDSDYGSYIFEVLAIDLAGNQGEKISKQLSLSAPSNGDSSDGGSGGGSTSTSIASTSSEEISTGENTLNINTEYPFNTGDETHHIIIDEIGTNYVWVTISSEPQKIKISFSDGKKEVDVNNDGIFDIIVELISISNNKVVLNYEEIDKSQEEQENINDLQKLGFSSNSMNETNHNNNFLTGAVVGFTKSIRGIGLLIGLIIIILAIIIINNRKR